MIQTSRRRKLKNSGTCPTGKRLSKAEDILFEFIPKAPINNKPAPVQVNDLAPPRRTSDYPFHCNRYASRSPIELTNLSKFIPNDPIDISVMIRFSDGLAPTRQWIHHLPPLLT